MYMHWNNESFWGYICVLYTKHFILPFESDWYDLASYIYVSVSY